MLRRFAGLQTCLALVLAFAMGPFQHVHQSQDHHPGGQDEEVSTLVHAHPYGISVAVTADGHARIDDLHHAHAAWSLETFTILPPLPQVFFFQPESKVLPLEPAESFFAVEMAERRGHDPPPLERLSPRAPPL